MHLSRLFLVYRWLGDTLLSVKWVHYVFVLKFQLFGILHNSSCFALFLHNEVSNQLLLTCFLFKMMTYSSRLRMKIVKLLNGLRSRNWNFTLNADTWTCLCIGKNRRLDKLLHLIFPLQNYAIKVFVPWSAQSLH